MKLPMLVFFCALFVLGCNQVQNNGYDLGKVLNNAISSRDPSLCGSSGLDKIDEGSCYYSYARETSNASVCEKIDFTGNDILSSRNGCYLQVARKTFDTSLCGRMQVTNDDPQTQIRNLCYYELAVAKNDSTLCARMTDIYKYYCPPCDPGANCITCHTPVSKQDCIERIVNGY